MRDWERIREARLDITDYVIHWVRPRYDGSILTPPFTILLEIIICGYLKPTFATRSSVYRETGRPTVKGPYPCVCFTEQNVKDFFRSCDVLPTHYHPYGIALNKRSLYQYGGRPVIYGSEDILGRQLVIGELGYDANKEIYEGGLPKDFQYLWVRYQPIPNKDNLVVDWTHEREWRCLAKVYKDEELGESPKEGVPLFLPGVYNHLKKRWIHYLPKIIVAKKEEKDLIETFSHTISTKMVEDCQSKYLRTYYKALPRVNIITVDEVKKEENIKNLRWTILEE